jgi:CO dehydrogenase maturation factor
MKVAVSGKGGAGKTTLAGVMARLLAERGKKVLAIDADPDANLASALGFPRELAAEIVPLADLKELIRERTGAKPGYGSMFKMNPEVDDIPDKYSRTYNDIKLLLMGGIQAGGSGCLCPESVVLKRVMEDVLIYRDDAVIMDMEAGLEHLGRATARSVETLIVVVEPGQRSVGTAEAVKRLAVDIGLKSVKVVANKVQTEEDKRFIESAFGADELLGTISYDTKILEADRRGVSPLDNDGEQLKDEVGRILDALGGAGG